MARVDIKSGGTILATGLLQLQNGVAMSTTLTAVTDQNNTASQLKLATNLTQVAGTLQIALDGGAYIDAQDTSGIDRFNVNRSVGSQQVNVDFSSNPTSATDAVGALRTYANGSALSEAMTFLRNGNVGVGTTTPGVKLDVHSGADNIAQLNRTGAGKSLLQYLLTGTARWATGFDNTNGNYTIYDSVNAADRVVVSNTGRLGVGTSAPAAPLDVNGDIKTNSNIYIQGNAKFIYANTGGGSVTTGLYFRPVDSLLDVYINGTAALTFGASTRTLIKGSGSTSATTSLLVQDSTGQEMFRIKDNNQIDFRQGQLSWINPAANCWRAVNGGSSPNVVGTSWLQSGNFIINDGSSLSSFDTSVILGVVSTTKGFLPPRMTNAQRLAIATPAVGLMVYCTDAVEGLYVYKSTGWTFVI